MVILMSKLIGQDIPTMLPTALPHSTPMHSYNAATRAIVSTLGVLIGIGSINHGLLECLQGNRPTPGLIVNALRSGYHWTVWTQGGEPAFTLIPNFLFTGILATVAGLLLILWSLRFIDSTHGPGIFLLLSVLSFLVGGGVAQIVLIALNWAMATRIRAPLRFWCRLMPSRARRILGRVWRWTVVVGTILFLAALEIAVVGYIPAVSGQMRILHLCWTLLLIALLLFLVAFVSGLAHDIEARSPLGNEHA
jgi:hypothetical protein